MGYVLVTVGGFLIGCSAADLWKNGFSWDKVIAGLVGLAFALMGVWL